MTEFYTDDPPSMAERLFKLSGGTTYREPMESHSTAGGNMPDSHNLAAALAFASRDKFGNAVPEYQAGCDVALSLTLRRPVAPERVVKWLAVELANYGGKAAERHYGFLPSIAGAAYWGLIADMKPVTVQGLPERDADWLAETGVSLLMDAANEAIRRASAAYHNDD